MLPQKILLTLSKWEISLYFFIMKTKVLSLRELDQAADLLKSGEPVAFPTETVYGLGAPIFQEMAIHKIFKIKGRPVDNPLIAHIADLQDVERIAVHLPRLFFLLAAHFFPGPLTLVVQKHRAIPSIVSAGLETIAIRFPNHPIAQALIQRVGEPLVAPSANLSGKPSPTLALHVLEDFEGKIAAVIDGGPCSGGIESTVLDLVSFDRPTLLRPGEISKEHLEEVLKCPIDLFVKNSHQKVSSPGMKYRHYAPNTPVTFIETLEQLKEHVTHSQAKRLLLSRISISGPFDWSVLSAQTLYAHLRRADRERYQEILIYCDEEIRNQLGLMNRIWHIVDKYTLYTGSVSII